MLITFFSCVNASHQARNSKFLVSRTFHYIIFQRIILWSIKNEKNIEVFGFNGVHFVNIACPNVAMVFYIF